MTAVLYSKDVEIEDYRNKLKETEAALALSKTTAINPSQDNDQQQQAKQQSDAARKRGREDMQSVDVPVDPASKRHKKFTWKILYLWSKQKLLVNNLPFQIHHHNKLLLLQQPYHQTQHRVRIED